MMLIMRMSMLRMNSILAWFNIIFQITQYNLQEHITVTLAASP